MRKDKSLKFKNNAKSNKNKKFRTQKQLIRFIESEEQNYFAQNIANSTINIKLCDITGLPAKYTCPTTGLNYFDSDVYKYISNMRAENVERIKALKNLGQEFNPFIKN